MGIILQLQSMLDYRRKSLRVSDILPRYPGLAHCPDAAFRSPKDPAPSVYPLSKHLVSRAADGDPTPSFNILC